MSKCDNSNFLFEKLFLPEATSDVCPTDVTLDMLKHELMCGDLQANVELMKDKDKLWSLFYYINRGSDNEFGFTFLGEKVSIPIVTAPLTNINTTIRSRKSTMKQKGPSVMKQRGPSAMKQRGPSTMKQRGPSTVKQRDPSTKRGIPTKSPTQTSRKMGLFSSMFGRKEKRRVLGGWYGGNNQFNENKKGYINLLNEVALNGDFTDLAPTWINNSIGGTTTLVKLKPVNRIQLYVNGSSLPEPDTYSSPKSLYNKQYCANTLSFYKYIKNISHIISLQGCNLDWNLIELPTRTRLPFRPSHCDGVDEKRNWDNICSNTEPSYDVNNSLFHEYYWIDMTAGFFETYRSIVSMDFTRPENKTLIHCYAGKGRTGAVLLMILSRYNCTNGTARRNFESNFNKGFFGRGNIGYQSNHSDYLCKYLQHLLLSHLDYDIIEYGDEIEMNVTVIDKINASIKKYDYLSIVKELFYGFYEIDTSGDLLISISLLNLFITRINYVIYFTAYTNGMTSVMLYQPYNTPDRVTILNSLLSGINIHNIFSLPLLFPIQVTVQTFEGMVMNNSLPIDLGVSSITPNTNYVEPQRTFSDDPKGDDRPSLNERPTPDEPLSDQPIPSNPTPDSQPVQYVSPLALRRAKQKAEQNDLASTNNEFQSVPL